MKRRNFIKKTSLTAISISAFGAINWNGKSFVGDTPTTTDILGPFYRPGAPLRSNIVPPGSNGSPLNLSGVVYEEDGMTPLENAIIEIWQCDENEYYDNTSDDYLFRGAVKTAKDGKYYFNTIVPVPYKAIPEDESSWRPAHIHFRVSSPTKQDLITQIYIKEDKYLDTDDSSSAPEAVQRILGITKNANNQNSVTFDIVMSKAFPLEDQVYKRIEGLYRVDDKIANSEMIFEFVRRDDLLFMKLKGQIVAGLKYVGKNTFEGGAGFFAKVEFELLSGGGVRSFIFNNDTKYIAEKFIKYGEL